jgi:hypothetical protein
VNRNHEVFASDRHRCEIPHPTFDTAFEFGPTRHQPVRECVRAGNPLGVDSDGALARRIEQQEQVCGESVPGGEFDHATTANPAPHSTHNLPGLEELFAWKALDLAGRTGDAGEESLARKPAQVAMREQRAAAGVEVHSSQTHAEAWTLGSFRRLFTACGDRGAQLFTYTASTAARVAMLGAGFYVAKGRATDDKPESTIAFTPAALECGARRHELLGADWLARWKRSGAKFPTDLPVSEGAAFEQVILQHDQFRGL